MKRWRFAWETATEDEAYRYGCALGRYLGCAVEVLSGEARLGNTMRDASELADLTALTWEQEVEEIGASLQ